jgi:hypothetical protein
LNNKKKENDFESKDKKDDLNNKKKEDLLIRISTVRPLLNGKTLDGKKADYAPGFRIGNPSVILSILLSVIVSKAVVVLEEVVMIGRDLDLDLDLNFYPNWLSSMVLGGKTVYKLVLDVILLTSNFHLSSIW